MRSHFHKATRRGGAVFCVLAALGLASCSADPPGLHVARQWGRALSQYGFTPLYPMQENIRIGDVFLTMRDEQGNFEPIPTRLTQANSRKLMRLLEDAYSKRFVFNHDRPEAWCDPCIAKRCPASPTKNCPPADDSVMTIGPPKLSIRLMNMALPALSVGQVASADLSGGGTAYGARIAAALGLANQSQINLTLTGLQEMSVPLADAYAFIDDQAPVLTSNAITPFMIASYIKQRNRKLFRLFCKGDLDTIDEKGGFDLTLANSVLYANGISYDYENDRGFLGEIAAGLASAPTLPTPATPTSSMPAPLESGGKGSGLSQAQQILQFLQSMAQTSSTPSASLSLGLSRSGVLSMDETFTRPMAVGFVSPINYNLNDLLPLWRKHWLARRDHEVSGQNSRPYFSSAVCSPYTSVLDRKITEPASLPANDP